MGTAGIFGRGMEQVRPVRLARRAKDWDEIADTWWPVKFGCVRRVNKSISGSGRQAYEAWH